MIKIKIMFSLKYNTIPPTVTLGKNPKYRMP